MSTPRGAAPRYAQLVSAIRSDIAWQRRLPGDRVPGDAELAAEFGVSKTTASKALEILVGEGLVERRTGVGSFVTGKKVPASTVTVPAGSVISVRWPHRGELEGFPPGVPVLVIRRPDGSEEIHPADRTEVIMSA